jgi:hypothetical protein
MNNGTRGKYLLLGLAGAAVGGVIGHFAAIWIVQQGFYALVLPGTMLGWGGGVLVKDRSIVRAVLCGLAALALGLFTDWRVEPFIADASLGYYLAHLSQLRPITLLMIAAGGALGAWFALGKEPLRINPAPAPGPGIQR